MAAPELPQEIINKIIDEHAEDTKSLRSCSLVVTRWNDRSRHHLFANLNITQDSLPQLQSLKQIKDHVRSLCLIQDEEIWITWRNLEEISNFFPRAESLTLRSTQKLTLLEVCQPAGFSNHFSRNLSSLTIEGSMSSDSFCLFIRLFPRLDNLELYGLCTTWKTLESSQISAIQKPTFRGTLTLYNLGCQYHPVTRPIVDHLLPMTFKDLRLDCCWFDTPESLEALLSKCQDTLKAIEVSSIQFIHDPQNRPINLSRFEGLEEVRLWVRELELPWSCAQCERILGTVTSNMVRKITFDIATFTVSDIGPNICSAWSSLDRMFLTMAKKLDGTGEKLEIVFNVPVQNNQRIDLGRFLKECRTKATVKFEHQ